MVEKTKKTFGFLCGFVILFFVFALRIVPDDIILLFAIGLFCVAPINQTIMMYIFSFVWCLEAVFSFGITFSLIISVLFVLKCTFFNPKMFLNAYEIFFLLLFLVIGMFNVLLYGTLTGVSICVYFYASCIIFHKLISGTREEGETFLKAILLMILIGFIEGTIYGYCEGTSILRWIPGFGYVKQLYGTLGTSRFTLYGCVALLYPLYYMKKNISKWVVFTIISIIVMLSVSLTAVVLYIGVIGYYILSNINLKKVTLKGVITVFCAIGVIIIIAPQLSKFSFMEPIMLRVDSIVNSIKDGNLNDATTGRTELTNAYVAMFKDGNLIQKVFGKAWLGYDELVGKYSHNSYLDILNYSGVLGLFTMFYVQLKRLKKYYKTKNFKVMLITKLILIIGATTVSTFSAQYWFGLLFI